MATITIIMPVRNCAGTVTAAVNSIIRQSYRDWELKLLEDGSDDQTLARARSFTDARVHVIADGEKHGLIARLNQGIALAQGPYIARMDGDDISYPDRLLKQTQFLSANPQIDLVGAGILVFNPAGDAVGRRTPRLDHTSICDTRTTGFGIAHPTFMGKTSWFSRFRYRPGALLCEDQDLLLRSHKESRFANLPDLLLGYREGELRLKNMLSARYHFAVAALKHARVEGGVMQGIHGASLQGAKAVWESVALATGMDKVMLAHRVHPLADAERAEWDRVYAWAMA